MVEGAKNARIFSKRRLHGQIAHKIGLQIVRGELQPGASLPNEQTASARLNVSRTAYREAMMVLVSKCLVESRPKTGTRVRPREDWNMLDPDLLAWNFEVGPNREYARSVFELRRIIEPAATSLATARANEDDIALIADALSRLRAATDCDSGAANGTMADLDFHMAILKATGNELLVSFGSTIETVLARSFELSNRLPGARRDAIPLHVAVFEEIKSRHPEAARAKMEELLTAAWEDIKDAIAASEAKEKP